MNFERNVSILMGPTFLVWNHSLNFINMVVLKRFNFSPRKKPINLWWRRTGISKPGIPELSTLSLKPYLFTQSNQRITNVLFWKHCLLKQSTWNPTIFNIIRWDDGKIVSLSHRLMVQLFFDRLGIIQWDSGLMTWP